MTPWRYRCPRGHCAWSSRARGDYYCERCEERFSELHDAKTGRVVA